MMDFKRLRSNSSSIRVETPMLAATVKGTSFTVTVDDNGANVEVKEGLVLVQNTASADETYVAAGRTASVVAAEPLTLYLDHNVVPPANLRLGDRPSRTGWANTETSGTTPATAVPMGGPKPHAATTADAPVPHITIATGSGEVRHRSATTVLDSTLFGLGVGILAAALAIIFIGTSRRPPGMVSVKRASQDEPAQGT